MYIGERPSERPEVLHWKRLSWKRLLKTRPLTEPPPALHLISPSSRMLRGHIIQSVLLSKGTHLIAPTYQNQPPTESAELGLHGACLAHTSRCHWMLKTSLYSLMASLLWISLHVLPRCTPSTHLCECQGHLKQNGNCQKENDTCYVNSSIHFLLHKLGSSIPEIYWHLSNSQHRNIKRDVFENWFLSSSC